MREIQADRRRRTAGTAPRAEAELVRGIREMHDARMRTARAMAEIQRTRSYRRHGCASAIEYAESNGLPPDDARMLLALGRTLEVAPSAEDTLRDARITPQAAAEIGKVVRKAETHPEAAPELLLAARTLLERAETVSPRTLRKEVRDRIESHAQGEPVVTMAIATTETTRERFRRARIVASNEAGAVLTDGQTMRVLTDEYLLRHDPTENTTRGCADAASAAAVPGRRYIPAAVKAAVRERSRGRCEVPGCSHVLGLQFMHLVPVAADGKSTVANVAQGCGDHHVALDAGLIQFVRWDANGAVFRMPDGGARRERGPRDPPAWQPPADEVRERPPPWGRSRRGDGAPRRAICGTRTSGRARGPACRQARWRGAPPAGACDPRAHCGAAHSLPVSAGDRVPGSTWKNMCGTESPQGGATEMPR